jgi:precorrin-3B synthase
MAKIGAINKVVKKGWCPSLEKPMESGDGLLVRIPVKAGRVRAEAAREIAALSVKYGNGHLDLSARGNLQIRGASAVTYESLRLELANLGFKNDFKLHIITSPLTGIDPDCAANTQEIASKIENSWENCYNSELPEKFLIVLDGGGIFQLSYLPADAYFTVPFTAEIVNEAIAILKNAKKCAKKPANANASQPPLGFMPFSENSGIVSLAATFGRIEAAELVKLADIAENYGSGEIIFAPFRRIILPGIIKEKAGLALQSAEETGFITKIHDARLNIHACVGSPACSSALGETRELAQKWAELFPGLTKTVHITGCPKGCAYKGTADITITAKENGYDIKV